MRSSRHRNCPGFSIEISRAKAVPGERGDKTMQASELIFRNVDAKSVCQVTSSPSHWFAVRCNDAEPALLKWTATAVSASELATSVGKPTPGSASAVGLIRCTRHRSRMSQYRTEIGGNRSRSSGSSCLVLWLPLLYKALTQSGRGWSGRDNEPERRPITAHFDLR